MYRRENDFALVQFKIDRWLNMDANQQNHTAK